MVRDPVSRVHHVRRVRAASLPGLCLWRPRRVGRRRLAKNKTPRWGGQRPAIPAVQRHAHAEGGHPYVEIKGAIYYEAGQLISFSGIIRGAKAALRGQLLDFSTAASNSSSTAVAHVASRASRTSQRRCLPHMIPCTTCSTAFRCEQFCTSYTRNLTTGGLRLCNLWHTS
jgi:hypothetical protein